MTVCVIACTDNPSSAIELLTRMQEPGSHYLLNSETTRIIDLRPWTIREGQDNPLASGPQKGMANTKPRAFARLPYFCLTVVFSGFKMDSIASTVVSESLEDWKIWRKWSGNICSLFLATGELRFVKQNYQGSLLELWNCCAHTDLSRNQLHLHFVFIADNLVSQLFISPSWAARYTISDFREDVSASRGLCHWDEGSRSAQRMNLRYKHSLNTFTLIGFPWLCFLKLLESLSACFSLKFPLT